MHYAIIVDLDRCSGCFSCEVACKNINSVALGSYYNKVLTLGPHGEFPKLEQYFLPVMCQQCEEAPCVHVCPTGASYRDPDNNVVLINKSVCIGCKYCMMACPYGVRSWNATQHVVEKCTLCGQLTSQGELPACVENCPAGARFYGDLDDASSDVSKKLAATAGDAIHSLTDVGNEPASRYVLSPKYAAWVESPVFKDGSSRYLEEEGE
jgi:Fe-S-cluster-containing dehydrogenase component